MSDNAVEVRWEESLRFEAEGESGVPVTVDGSGERGPTPMEGLLVSLAACMAIDVVDILGKMRVSFEDLSVRAEGDRRADPPRRYTAIRLIYRTAGISDDAQDRLQRAVDLSREKYCSVLHTLQPDLDLTIRIEAG